MSVDVSPGAVFHAGVAELVVRGAPIRERFDHQQSFLDVAPDGQRFLINTLGSYAASTPETRILDSQEGLKK
jgi:hypothetical protein